MSSKKNILLVGGGHSNIQVLHSLSKIDRSLFKLTLISEYARFPYSGMIPGYFAGLYPIEKLEFDLREICNRFDYQFIEDQAIRINSETQQVETAKGHYIKFDICSLNLGIVPTKISSNKMEMQNIFYLKPTSKACLDWEKIKSSFNPQSQKLDLTIVGGGAAAFEIAIACRQAFGPLNTQIKIITGLHGLLKSQNRKTQIQAKKALLRHNIEIFENVRVTDINANQIFLSDGRRLPRQICFVSTSAKGSVFFEESQLPVTPEGFVHVKKNLLVEGSQNIFASGDCCHFLSKPLPKAGVFAVREGPILSKNIISLIKNENVLTDYKPQANFLTILVSGKMQAIASYKNFSYEGKFAWLLKNYIDLKFMSCFK